MDGRVISGSNNVPTVCIVNEFFTDIFSKVHTVKVCKTVWNDGFQHWI